MLSFFVCREGVGLGVALIVRKIYHLHLPCRWANSIFFTFLSHQLYIIDPNAIFFFSFSCCGCCCCCCCCCFFVIFIVIFFLSVLLVSSFIVVSNSVIMYRYCSTVQSHSNTVMVQLVRTAKNSIFKNITYVTNRNY